MNNNEKIANVLVGGMYAIAGAVTLSVPFLGFGPMLTFCAAVFAASVVVRVMDDHLNRNKTHAKPKKGVKATC